MMRQSFWRRGGLAILVLLLVLGGRGPVGMGTEAARAAEPPGTVRSWGDDIQGQLGDGTVGSPAANPTPKAVPGVAGIVAIAAGARHSLAVKGDGTVLAWGSDTFGELGDGTVGGTSATPQAVPGVSGGVAVSAGFAHSLALKGDGTLLAWGFDSAGALGDGTVGPRANPTPQAVPGVTGIAAIAAGGGYSLALVAPSSGSGFGDLGGLPAGTQEAIRQLAARSVIRGCDPDASPPLFCPGDPTLRAQMAALIVRAMGWSGETPANPFKDQCGEYCIDNELWNAVGILAAKDVARG